MRRGFPAIYNHCVTVTVVLALGSQHLLCITTTSPQLEVYNRFSYLGSVISYSSSCDDETKQRIGKVSSLHQFRTTYSLSCGTISISSYN